MSKWAIRSKERTTRINSLLFVSAAVLSASELVAAGPVAFTEEAQARGIVYVPTQQQGWGQGVAFVDLDEDGDPDVVTLGDGLAELGLYENDGSGYFTSRWAASGIGLVPDTSGVSAGDYDRDGDLDLHISRYDAPDLLLRNDGGFQFVDVAAAAGVDVSGAGHGCAWADFDNDGWLDLYLADRSSPNRLFRNLGNGTFQDVAVALGVDRGLDPTFQAAFFDYDRDGDADLYLATDKGLGCVDYRNHFFENVGGAFVEITDSSGTEACLDSMCVAIGDFDGNRYLDLYVTNTESGNALLMNQGIGPFVRQEGMANVASYAVGWGAVFFDYDNDGHLDLYVCNMGDNNRLYRHDGTWPCTDAGASMGVDTGGLSYATAVADVDGDGDLDLLVQNRAEPIRLFINHEGQTRRWSKFDVVGEGPARYAVGANVDVRVGSVWRQREVIAGCNYKSQNELALHFGLNNALVMDEIQVLWPGGTARTLFNLPSNETWTLYPPDKLGDGDFDGDRDLDDFFVFAECMPTGTAEPVQPGCEMMDYDGDGSVDPDDIDPFLAAFDTPLGDCNLNGVLDLKEILLDPSRDANGDGVMDLCLTVPTVQEWGLVVTSLLLLSAGSLLFRHRSTAQPTA